MARARTGFRTALTALIVLTLALPATAAAESLDLRYSLSLRGIPAGEMTLRYEEDGDTYRSELTARARGLAKLLSGYRSTAVSQGQISAENRLVPTSYRWVSDQRNKTWTTDVVFEPDTGDVVSLDLRKSDKPRQTEVPEELQRDVLDPVAAIVRLRRHAAEALAGGPQRFEVSVFDGRRRYDIEAEMLGRATATIDRRERPVVEVRLSFHPLAGFDKTDLSRLPGRDGYALAQLSDDEHLLPLRIETRGAPGRTAGATSKTAEVKKKTPTPDKAM
jgi:hypothetical protein